MALDLNQCDKACFGCIKRYKGKHRLRQGQEFSIKCRGIPDFAKQGNLFSGFNEAARDTAITLLDPVKWAIETLDWHCLDPEGEVWKRKNPEEHLEWMETHPGESILGHSRYHRPYQAEMLRCTSKRKVFRIGRQAGKTEAIVVSMLYHLFTKPGIGLDEGFKIIVITPYQAQIDLIFKRCLQLIRSNPSSNNSLRRHVKAPIYTIELHNNSAVMGFTAGTKSGGNAEAVRGQHGHMLVFDEADYLSSGDMDAALSIITNFPQAAVWMSSTPSGKREKFYQTCHSKLFREFYYTSEINPMWSHEQELLFRENLTELGYKHEIEAEFGEQEQGVFQNVYVQNAKLDYNYGDIPRRNTWTYSMGVDWNDTKIGTSIIVLGFDPSRNIFQIVDRHIVSREGWNQLAACEKIAELNRIWRPMVIYLDSGFGGTQYEVLRKFGYDSTVDKTKGPNHPDSKLKSITKQYQFGGSVEVRDLFTKMPIKKPAKSFLVESTIRRFETGDIKFSENDTELERQLLNYIVARITTSGAPVYESVEDNVGDHTLDALMLAIIGFVMESTPLGNPKFQVNIAFSGQFGQNHLTPIHEGDTVLTNNSIERVKQKKNKSRPYMNRTSTIEQSVLLGASGGMPGSHIRSGSQVSLWDWPGFSRDTPRPKVRSLTEAENDARYGRSNRPRRASRPQRKNI